MLRTCWRIIPLTLTMAGFLSGATAVTLDKEYLTGLWEINTQGACGAMDAEHLILRANKIFEYGVRQAIDSDRAAPQRGALTVCLREVPSGRWKLAADTEVSVEQDFAHRVGGYRCAVHRSCCGCGRFCLHGRLQPLQGVYRKGCHGCNRPAAPDRGRCGDRHVSATGARRK